MFYNPCKVTRYLIYVYYGNVLPETIYMYQEINNGWVMNMYNVSEVSDTKVGFTGEDVQGSIENVIAYYRKSEGNENVTSTHTAELNTVSVKIQIGGR